MEKEEDKDEELKAKGRQLAKKFYEDLKKLKKEIIVGYGMNENGEGEIITDSGRIITVSLPTLATYVDQIGCLLGLEVAEKDGDFIFIKQKGKEEKEKELK